LAANGHGAQGAGIEMENLHDELSAPIQI